MSYGILGGSFNSQKELLVDYVRFGSIAATHTDSVFGQKKTLGTIEHLAFTEVNDINL